MAQVMHVLCQSCWQPFPFDYTRAESCHCPHCGALTRAVPFAGQAPTRQAAPKAHGPLYWTLTGMGISLGFLVLCSGLLAPRSGDVSYCQALGRQKVYVFAWIDPTKADDLDAVRRAVRSLDSRRERIIGIGFWTDRAKAARRLPMSDAEVDAQVGQYWRNDGTGHRELIWRGHEVPL